MREVDLIEHWRALGDRGRREEECSSKQNYLLCAQENLQSSKPATQ